MPRRSSRQTASAIASTIPELQSERILDEPEQNLFNLRRNWKWAAFTQFFYIFFDLFAINDVSVTDIENDLVHGTDIFLPRIMQRLLYTLTFDRKITVDNWQNSLRKQYDKRDPDSNPLGPFIAATASNSRLPSVLKEEEETQKPSVGTPEANPNPDDEGHDEKSSEGKSSREATEDPLENEPPKEEEDEKQAPQSIDWSQLDILQKLDALHTLVEWQFQNPLRLRGIMKSDDELASWRSEPVGYDRVQNAYWLIGGDRLWIQRAPPKPANKKRKRKEPPTSQKARNTAKHKSAKRRKTQTTEDAGPSRSAQPVTPNSRSRAAKEQAKAKLDAQAKALAEYQRQVAETPQPSRSNRSTRNSKAAPPQISKPAGTRTSSRLRNLQDDGWQQVPKEWLQSGSNESPKPAKTGLESDDESASDLTELSDDDEGSQSEDNDAAEEESKQKSPTPESEPEQQQQQELVEWETLCVTLAEWETFPERFASSTHYIEKAFYKYLTTILVPEVTHELKQLEQKRRLEEALNHRKRSSRLAHKESEKEAARLAAQRKADEEAQNARARRLEARQQREAEEREKRERAREERRAQRESRVGKRGASASKSEREDGHTSDENEVNPQANGKRKALSQSTKTSAKAGTKASAGSRTPASDDWELDCEICGRRGKNLDDGKPMLCCGQCNKWQHIACHDKMDMSQGRPKRDWDKTEFLCRRCLAQRHPSLVAARAPPPHPATAIYSYPSHGWQNGTYGDPRSQPHHDPSAFARSTIGQTSSLRTSAYPPPQSSYPQPQPNTITFSHYQPQERAFTDPNRVPPQQQQNNPYLRPNGSWSAEHMKYQTYQPYGAQAAWNAGYPSGGSMPPHQAPGASTSTPMAPSHQVDMNYHRPPYDQRPAPRETYPPLYYPATTPHSLPMQPYSHTRTSYPPQS